ncbi:hypothetical protein SAMN00120144_2787 [Hymenobacter roseosalivarius DSM 11622]|uniref:Uncharacterized protein n=1 Tax=Hymenobacter roseosalivarius DSM 11622 TaxID=645990 RepID=A0A1W1W2I8_9BACT|nr:hypothetical protein [Hymenobacter roseosalivarius]SMB99829.1 hypothetical protein SAMN00120144_2787 [Hymenobacter roseosalivarius DSM 11622]
MEPELGVELVNALFVQISPEFLQDSAADPNLFNLFRNTRLMRVSYEYFAPFRQHAAVRRTQQLADNLGTSVYLLPLFYEGFPQPRRHTPISPEILEALHPNPDSATRQADEYLQLVGRFYREAHFAHFQRRYRHAYTQAVAEVRRNLPPPSLYPSHGGVLWGSKSCLSPYREPIFQG